MHDFVPLHTTRLVQVRTTTIVTSHHPYMSFPGGSWGALGGVAGGHMAIAAVAYSIN